MVPNLHHSNGTLSNMWGGPIFPRSLSRIPRAAWRTRLVFKPRGILKMTNELDFWRTRKDFLAHLNYIKGYSPRTCYNYNSDLGIFGRWLEEMGKDWRAATHVDIEQFAGWQMRVRKVSAHIVSRRS